MAARVQLSTRMLNDALAAGGFGAAWRAVESTSLRLARWPLKPSQLAAQCARGEALLARMNIPFSRHSDITAVMP